MPTYVYVGCPDGNWKSPGEWLGTGRGLGPCSMSSKMLNQGLPFWVAAGPIIQHHYEVLAIWLRARLS